MNDLKENTEQPIEFENVGETTVTDISTEDESIDAGETTAADVSTEHESIDVVETPVADISTEDKSIGKVSEKKHYEAPKDKKNMEEETVFNPENEVITIKKLVRDKSIQILESSGIDCRYKSIKNTRFKYALFRKLVEESTECHNATGVNFKIELADVLTVFFNIISILKISLSELKGSGLKKVKSMVSISKECLLQMGSAQDKQVVDIKEKLGEFWESFSNTLSLNNTSIVEVAKIAEKKDKERGSFSSNIFLIEISGPSSNPIIQKYLKSYKRREKIRENSEDTEKKNIEDKNSQHTNSDSKTSDQTIQEQVPDASKENLLVEEKKES